MNEHQRRDYLKMVGAVGPSSSSATSDPMSTLPSFTVRFILLAVGMITAFLSLVAGNVIQPLNPVAAGEPKKAEGRKEPGLVFSVKNWDGEYYSKDIPGGVETTPVVGAIYTINADGSGLKKI